MSKVVKANSPREFKCLLNNNKVEPGDFVQVTLNEDVVGHLFSLRDLNPRSYKEVHAKGYAASWSRTSNSGVEIFSPEHFNAIVAKVEDPSDGKLKWTLVRGQHTVGALTLCDVSVYGGKSVIVSIGDENSGLVETNTRNQSASDKANVLSTHLKQDASKCKAVAKAIHGIATAFTDRTNGKRITGSDFVEQVSWFLNEHEDLFDEVSTSPNTWKFTKKRGRQERRVSPAFATSLALLWHFHDGTDFRAAYDEILSYNLFANVGEGQHVLLWCALQEIADSVQGVDVARKSYRGEGHLRYAFKALLACLSGAGDQDFVQKQGCLTREKVTNSDGDKVTGKGYSWIGGKDISGEWNTTYPASEKCVKFVKELTGTYQL